MSYNQYYKSPYLPRGISYSLAGVPVQHTPPRPVRQGNPESHEKCSNWKKGLVDGLNRAKELYPLYKSYITGAITQLSNQQQDLINKVYAQLLPYREEVKQIALMKSVDIDTWEHDILKDFNGDAVWAGHECCWLSVDVHGKHADHTFEFFMQPIARVMGSMGYADGKWQEIPGWLLDFKTRIEQSRIANMSKLFTPVESSYAPTAHTIDPLSQTQLPGREIRTDQMSLTHVIDPILPTGKKITEPPLGPVYDQDTGQLIDDDDDDEKIAQVDRARKGRADRTPRKTDKERKADKTTPQKDAIVLAKTKDIQPPASSKKDEMTPKSDKKHNWLVPAGIAVGLLYLLLRE
jgi:hypothetical protein